MTDTAKDSTEGTARDELPAPPADFRTPEQEMAEVGADVPDADELSLEAINPLNAHLFEQDRWQGHFARLRSEDPIHFNEIATAGRYWSVTKYHDIKEIEADWETFSSAKGITLGIQVDKLPEDRQIRTFIAMDPPEHREQRRTVTPSIQPRHLNENVEPLIRERTVEVPAGGHVVLLHDGP